VLEITFKLDTVWNLIVRARPHISRYVRENKLDSIIMRHLITSTSTQFTRLNGKSHQGGGLPAMIFTSGTKLWYWNGVLHRSGDKSAVKDSKYYEYWVNGITL
jgi:hypothetical protein